MNMKIHSKLLCLALVLMSLTMAIDVVAKPKLTKVYVFGVSTSYTDSVTFLTDIQALHPAYIESKTGFLYDRSIYSQQLQIWIESMKDKPFTTCTIFFSKNRRDVEKKFLKVQKKIRADKSTRLMMLDAGEFRFIPQEWSEHETI